MEELTPTPTQTLTVPVAIIIAAVLISGSIFLTSKVRINNPETNSVISTQPIQDASVTATPVITQVTILASDHILGNASAPVTMVEYSDFQCPFCRVFWEFRLPQIKKDYIDTGKVRLVYRHYPLTQLHPSARISAEISECAAVQGKFWQFHDALFSEQAKLGKDTPGQPVQGVDFSEQDIYRWAKAAGLNTDQLSACVASKKYSGVIEGDIAFMDSLNQHGTPTFFINGTMLVGAQDYSVFKAALDEAYLSRP